LLSLNARLSVSAFAPVWNVPELKARVLGRRRNDDPKRLATVQRLRKKGVGIGKIARTLGIGTSYVQRVVAGTE
jgi:hypothetical protein